MILTKSRLLDMQVDGNDTKTSLNDEIARRLRVQIFNFAANRGMTLKELNGFIKLK